MAAILRGIAQANLELQTFVERVRKRISEVEIVELYVDSAIEAARAAKRLAGPLERRAEDPDRGSAAAAAWPLRADAVGGRTQPRCLASLADHRGTRAGDQGGAAARAPDVAGRRRCEPTGQIPRCCVPSPRSQSRMSEQAAPRPASIRVAVGSCSRRGHARSASAGVDRTAGPRLDHRHVATSPKMPG